MKPPPPRTRSDKDALILQAATTIMLTHGFSAATTDMIQREAGVSKATLYARFPTKEAMFAAAIETECQKMSAEISAITPGPGGLTGVLHKIGAAYLKIILSPSGLALARVVIADAPRFPDLGRRFYLAGPRMTLDMVAQRIEEAQAAGDFKAGGLSVEDAAAAFVGLLRSEAQMQALTHPETQVTEAQILQWTERAVSTFMAAFEPAPVGR